MKNPPHTYIQKLRGFLDPAVTRKVRWEMEFVDGLTAMMSDFNNDITLSVFQFENRTLNKAFVFQCVESLLNRKMFL